MPHPAVSATFSLFQLIDSQSISASGSILIAAVLPKLEETPWLLQSSAVFMLWRILSLGCKLWIKISPEQGHTAHTHTAHKHSVLPQSMHQPPFLAPASLPAPSQPCLPPGDEYTELAAPPAHLPMQGQEAHTGTQSCHSHLTGTHTRGAVAPTALRTHTEAKRHYGRHSLGFVLLIVSTGLNVSGQFYLHIAE